MKLIGRTAWEDVFSGWRSREANNPGWVTCATEVKGWPDWESWRRFSAHQIGAEKRNWEIFEWTDPSEEIPQMLIGPYSGWQARVAKKNATTFEELLDIPDQLTHFLAHTGIAHIREGLPFSTEFIGLIRDDNRKIVCLEGHHRAVAIALVKRLGKNVDFSKTRLTIALAHLPIEECHVLDDALRRGTSRTPNVP